MSKEKKFAVLIDAENISAQYVNLIFEELSNIDSKNDSVIVTYRRIYGDWTKSNVGKWKEVLLDHSIQPIQQYAYTTGKNASDSAMIIDAMDILYSGNVQGFCLVSSDSDFTRLATRLRESGMQVIGMGESKANQAFTRAFSTFKYLDLLSSDSEHQENNAKRAEVGEIIKKIILEHGDNNAKINIGELGSRLQKIQPDFDVKHFGYTQLSKFLSSFDFLELKEEDSSRTAYLKKNEQDKDMEAILYEIVKTNKNQKMDLGQLNKIIKNEYPNFNVKSLGYSTLMKYIDDLTTLEVESSGENGCVKTVILKK